MAPDPRWPAREAAAEARGTAVAAAPHLPDTDTAEAVEDVRVPQLLVVVANTSASRGVPCRALATKDEVLILGLVP